MACIKVLNNLSAFSKSTKLYKKIDGADKTPSINYTLHFSKHLNTPRKISNSKGYQSRIVDGLRLKSFKIIIEDILPKLIEKGEGKYVISLLKSDNGPILNLLIAFEKNKFIENEWFILLITTLVKNESMMSFKDIPVDNRLFSNIIFDDLMEVPIIEQTKNKQAQEQFKKNKKNQYDPEYVKRKLLRPGLRIKKKVNPGIKRRGLRIVKKRSEKYDV